MAVIHLSDGCTLVCESPLRCDEEPMCHDFSPRYQVLDETGDAFGPHGGGETVRGDQPQVYIYDLCSKCGARLYPPGAYRAAESGDGK